MDTLKLNNDHDEDDATKFDYEIGDRMAVMLNLCCWTMTMKLVFNCPAFRQEIK